VSSDREVNLFGRSVRVTETTFGRGIHHETYVLTAEHLEKFFEKISTEIIIPCGATSEKPHVVHPRAVGWGICGNCGMPVRT
jgi:hypothetical protein